MQPAAATADNWMNWRLAILLKGFSLSFLGISAQTTAGASRILIENQSLCASELRLFPQLRMVRIFIRSQWDTRLRTSILDEPE